MIRNSCIDTTNVIIIKNTFKILYKVLLPIFLNHKCMTLKLNLLLMDSYFTLPISIKNYYIINTYSFFLCHRSLSKYSIFKCFNLHDDDKTQTKCFTE